MSNMIVNQFCTPPLNEISKFDTKSLADAEITYIDAEGLKIPIYSWGKGKNILLVHGWGSKASHMTLFVRFIVNAGFSVHAFDAPAHSSIKINDEKTQSNMFEYGRSISAVASHLGNVHAIIAHSMGGLTSLLTIAGHMSFAKYKFNINKLAVISSPSSLKEVILSFSRSNKLTNETLDKLCNGLEKEYNFKISDYDVKNISGKLNNELMIVHDEDDDEVPIANAYVYHNKFSVSKLHLTRKLGHKKILLSREMIKQIIEFISD